MIWNKAYKIEIDRGYYHLYQRDCILGIPINSWNSMYLPFKSIESLQRKLSFHNIKKIKLMYGKQSDNSNGKHN